MQFFIDDRLSLIDSLTILKFKVVTKTIERLKIMPQKPNTNTFASFGRERRMQYSTAKQAVTPMLTYKAYLKDFCSLRKEPSYEACTGNSSHCADDNDLHPTVFAAVFSISDCGSIIVGSVGLGLFEISFMSSIASKASDGIVLDCTRLCILGILLLPPLSLFCLNVLVASYVNDTDKLQLNSIVLH